MDLSSSQAKGTKSTSFLTHVRNEMDLVPLAWKDVDLCVVYVCGIFCSYSLAVCLCVCLFLGSFLTALMID